jgi:glucosamine 6-phosphate synthetase-like amidotransferase/phosphosugar isomerase protein
VARVGSEQPWTESQVWREATAIPDVLAEIVDADAMGESDVVRLLRPARRLVATGNGAAYYAALALWAAALERLGEGPEVVAIPAGLLATGQIRWRAGDVPLVFSSSGELRDVVGLAPDGLPPYALITATPDSTLARHAQAVTVVPVRTQDAITHTQAYTGNVLAGLLAWGRAAGSALDLRDVPAVVHDNLRAARTWVDALNLPIRTHAGIVFGSGGGWPAALETALLLKEIASLPTEGMETREGATSGMYALGDAHLAVSLPTRDDALISETEQICARTGATVIRVPGGENHPATLAPITTFPAALALATALGTAAGRNVDDPDWTAAYYATARTTGEVSA